MSNMVSNILFNSAKSSTQITISNKNAKSDVNMIGQIAQIYTLEEILTYPSFILKQLNNSFVKSVIFIN